jgi:predicted glycosyltransferase involved in capsule biosynthesis
MYKTIEEERASRQYSGFREYLQRLSQEQPKKYQAMRDKFMTEANTKKA